MEIILVSPFKRNEFHWKACSDCIYVSLWMTDIFQRLEKNKILYYWDVLPLKEIANLKTFLCYGWTKK